MADATTWVVPGAPLMSGGWRIWYCQPGHADFRPVDPTVSLGDRAQAISTSWSLLPPLSGIERRMGVLYVDLQQPQSGTTYLIDVPEAQQGKPFRWTTIGDPRVEPVSFLLSSCFWRDNDKDGGFTAAVADLCKLHTPAFKLLVGDQVYQDWPSTLLSFRSPLQQYADRYDQYWGDAERRKFFQVCPNYFLADDHEYWNDFPERQLHLQRTYTASSRRKYRLAAQTTYEYYQQSCNGAKNGWLSFGIGDVSFFISDSRSQRDAVGDSPAQFFQNPQWDDLRRWAKALKGPGVLVLGQPLYQGLGNWKDHSLSNFPDDYYNLCDLIRTTIESGYDGGTPHDILMLSGDIHTGRYCVRSVITTDGRTLDVPELIASAASRISPASSDPELAPGRLRAQASSGLSINWFDRDSTRDRWTIDNNIGLVRMSQGRANKIRFELSVWRMQSFDSAKPVTELFKEEVELG